MENKEKVLMELEQILSELCMAPTDHRDFGWLQEVILMAVRDPATWEEEYAEYIGKRANISRERIRQILHKAAWNNWKADSGEIIKNHFGDDVQMNFEYIKPNHVEFISLVADNLREKYQIQPKKGEFDWSQIAKEENVEIADDNVCEESDLEDFLTVDSDEDS